MGHGLQRCYFHTMDSFRSASRSRSTYNSRNYPLPEITRLYLIEILITIGMINQNATQSESKHRSGCYQLFLTSTTEKEFFFDGFLLYPAH